MKAVQWEPEDRGQKDLWNKWVLSLEGKAEGVTDGDSEDRYCAQVIRYVQDDVNQEEIE